MNYFRAVKLFAWFSLKSTFCFHYFSSVVSRFSLSSYYTVNIIHRVLDAIKFRKIITLVSGAFIQGVSVTCYC